MLRASLTSNEYKNLCGLLTARCGLTLSDDHRDLVASRLRPIALLAGVADLRGLAAKLNSPGSDALMVQVIDAIVSHDIVFFRDTRLFQYVRESMLPALLDARRARRRIRIWCAAASTGQEPYSLAMILADMPAMLANFRIDLLATDLSGAALARARQGTYSQSEIQCGLPIALLLKHFLPAGDMWQIAPELRAMVRFEQVNLLENFSALGTFDVIFCRNVLSGLDPAAKRDVLGRIEGVMAPDGYLVLGDAEAATEQKTGLFPISGTSGVFVCKPAPGPMRSWGPLAGARRAAPPRLTVVSGHG